MNRFALRAASAALVVLASVPLSAQHVSPPAGRDTSAAVPRVVIEAAADSAVRDLGRALSALALSVQEIVAQTANKPEVRLAAVQVARGAVTLAQRTLAENALEIERLLSDASRRLSASELAQKAKAGKP